jgi:dolichol-phosphate mannosyltransferase
MTRPAPLISVVTPAFNEARNLPLLYERLAAVLGPEAVAWEWIVVDDHSRDPSFQVVSELAARDARVRGVRLARNGGSHMAIACGLEEAQGAAAIVMAADLQDPPETLPALMARWRDGAQVVWAARRQVPGQPGDGLFSRLYYWMMRNLVGMREMPSAGADFFLLDRAVIDAFCSLRERHASVLALITWLGFRQEQILYDKQPRLHGASGWSLRRKFKLVFDSITGFSDLPVVASWMLGALLIAVGMLFAVLGFAGVALGVLGPAAVVLLGAVAGGVGLGLVMLGFIGEYVWRALDEGRQRPRYFIEQRTPAVADRTAAHRSIS